MKEPLHLTSLTVLPTAKAAYLSYHIAALGQRSENAKPLPVLLIYLSLAQVVPLHKPRL